MYSYKINNSYTVYVNWAYYAEAAKACKHTHAKGTGAKAPVAVSKAVCPFPRGTMVESKFFGIGRIREIGKDGTFSVQFDSKVARFLYPDAFKQGHLSKVAN